MRICSFLLALFVAVVVFKTAFAQPVQCYTFKWNDYFWSVGTFECESDYFCASQVELRDGHLVVTHFNHWCQRKADLPSETNSAVHLNRLTSDVEKSSGCYPYKDDDSKFLCYCGENLCNNEENMKTIFREYKTTQNSIDEESSGESSGEEENFWEGITKK